MHGNATDRVASTGELLKAELPPIPKNRTAPVDDGSIRRRRNRGGQKSKVWYVTQAQEPLNPSRAPFCPPELGRQEIGIPCLEKLRWGRLPEEREERQQRSAGRQRPIGDVSRGGTRQAASCLLDLVQGQGDVSRGV